MRVPHEFFYHTSTYPSQAAVTAPRMMRIADGARRALLPPHSEVRTNEINAEPAPPRVPSTQDRGP